MNSGFLMLLLFLYSHLFSLHAESPTNIIIDGEFGDWINVRTYHDPQDNIAGTVYQDSVPDCHNITTTGRCDIPTHLYNPSVDIIEYAMAHDEDNLYAYVKVVGDIRNSTGGDTIDTGMSYVVVMLDLDDNIDTGFCGNEGGFYPAVCGFDMSFKIELMNRMVSSAAVTLHSMENQIDYDAAKKLILENTITFHSAAYRPYAQWVYWDDSEPITDAEKSRCTDGPYSLPGSNHPVICFIPDVCLNCNFKGVMNYAFSSDNHSIEFSVPFRSFMYFPDGIPAIKQGNRITTSFSLQNSNQSSDSSWPIRGYLFEPTNAVSPSPDLWEDRLIAGAIGLVVGATIATIIALLATTMKRKGYKPVE